MERVLWTRMTGETEPAIVRRDSHGRRSGWRSESFDDEGRVIEAVEKAVSAKVSTSDAVEYILLNARVSKGPSFGPLETWPRLSPPDLSVYSRIGGEL